MRARPPLSHRPRPRGRWRLAGPLLAGSVLLSGCMSMSMSTTDPGLPAFTTAKADSASGAALPAGTSVQTWTAPDGTALQYVLVVPPGRVAGQPGKVLITFPPGDQTLALAQQVVQQTWQAEAIKREYLVISPAATAKGLFSQSPGGDLLQPFIDAMSAKYPPQGGKFDLAGVSNGGVSAFRAAIGRPQDFGSLVVFPGTPPTGVDPSLTALAGLGVGFFVGAKDSPDWLNGSQTAAAALRRLGNRASFYCPQCQR